MHRILLTIVAFLCASVVSAAVPFWGAKESQPVDTAPDRLKPGQFIWNPGVAPTGPIVVLVSIDEQRGYVYRNGIEIGVTSVSTGRPGHETPTGIFTVLQKDKDHHSSIYNDAAMPYQERLTWGGVALHAGGLPGYPESHGCIHLPSQFAAGLFGVSPMGMTVVVVKNTTAPAEVAHPGAFAPIDPKSGELDEDSRLAVGEQFRWTPEASPVGPISALMSRADQRVIVFRNGIEIGRARIVITESDKPLGTHAFIVKEGQGEGSNAAVPGAPVPRWTAINMPGHFDAEGRDLPHAVTTRIKLPPEFAKALFPLLVPGTTLLVTDAPVLEENTGGKVQVIDSNPPAS